VAGAAILLSVVSIGTRFDGADSDWRDSALAFHDMYLRAQQSAPLDAMIEIVQNQPDELARLIDFAPSMPDLAAHGYEPAGAHVLAAPQGNFVYVLFNAAERPPVGFAMARRRAGPAAPDLDEPVVRVTGSSLKLVSWSAGSFEYALSAEMPAADLLELADTVRRSVSPESL
jgi:anti-sigma factor RsiW